MAWGRLALIHAAGETGEVLPEMAASMDYRLPVRPQRQQDARFQNPIVDTLSSEAQKQSTSDSTKTAMPPARFLRVRRMTRKQPDNEAKADYLSDPAWQFGAEDRRQGGTYQFAKPEPLLPMSRLLPFLLNSLGQQRPGARLDHRLLARQVAKGQAVKQLPFLLRQRWSQRLLILVDASQRLEPYWADFEFIVDKLQQQLGTEAVTALRFDEAYRGRELRAVRWPDSEGQWRAWQTPAANVPILMLGDLGVDDKSGDSRAFWLRIAGRLHAHDAPVLTLNPLGHSVQAQRLNRRLQPNPLHDQQRLPRYPLRNGFDVCGQVDRDHVLACLSVLPVVDTGLLRRLRQRLDWGGSELEGQLWNHPDIQQTALGIRVRNDSDKYQRIYQHQVAGTEAAQILWQVVTEHHQDAYPGLRQLEQASRCVTEQQDSADVRAYLQRLAASVVQDKGGLQQRAALLQQAKTVLSVLPEQVWASDFSDLAYDVFALVHDKAIRAGDWPELLPAGFEPAKAARRVLERREQLETERWQIVQVGSEGEFAVRREQQFPDLQTTVVARLTCLRNLPPVITYLSHGEGQKILAKEGQIYSAGVGVVGVECSTHWFELEAVSKPNWASQIWRDGHKLKAEIIFASIGYPISFFEGNSITPSHWAWSWPFGEDQYGLYADININKITQRFRWIEPGTFIMGSPADEPGRSNNEDQHTVILTQGYWLADTTVTQRLWEAVMGVNPSYFKNNPDHPVETVSWDDCQQFITKLNTAIPGLQARLPTEAQWEYACRVGTNTAFSFGGKDDLTLEKVNYSGKWNEFDVSGSTKPVKSYPRNDWGLYEMHGNVLEWCQDVWQENLGTAAVIDPEGLPASKEALRGWRGGSWNDRGWCCRSAFRNRAGSDLRLHHIGLRLSLGHAELMQGAGSAESGANETSVKGGADSAAPNRPVAEQGQAGAAMGAVGKFGESVRNLLGRFRGKK